MISTQSTDPAAGIVVNLGKFYNTRDLVINLPIPTGYYAKIIISFQDEAGNIVYEKESTKGRTVSVGEMHVFKPIVITHPYVDLGLPSGTLWAAYNVGASSPEEYGDYFSYGETSPKDWYSGATYTFDKSLAKGENLAVEDDAAYVNWGEEWRMPTKDEWQELIDNCSYIETEYNKVKGWMLTGPNGSTIFLPHTGMFYSDNDDWCIGSGAQYLSSTCSSSWSCYVSNTLWGVSLKESEKYYGRPLRAVKNTSGEVSLMKSLIIEVGKSSALNLNNISESVVWSSLDESIATVSDKGVVTAVAEGKTEIRATVGSVTRSCEVSVVERPNMNVKVIAKSCSIINGTIMRGSSVTWMLENRSSSVVDLKTAQIVDYGSSLYGNQMDLNETVFANESTAYTITFNSNIPTTSVIIYTVEYKGHLFEYKAGID